MGTDVIDQLRTYLDYAGAAGETLVTRPDTAPASWYRRGPVLVGAAVLIVLILAVPSLLLSPNTIPPADEQLSDPLDLNRPSNPVASTVTVISVTGDSNSEIVELWADWWRAYAEVRESASNDGSSGSFNPGPLEELAVDTEAAFQAIALLGTVEADGGPVEVGEPSEIRLAPHIQVEGALATIRDCVYLDPIPWPGLRHSDSTGGTAVITAEAQQTVDGWRISDFGPESLVQQFAAEPCQIGTAD